MNERRVEGEEGNPESAEIKPKFLLKKVSLGEDFWRFVYYGNGNNILKFCERLAKKEVTSIFAQIIASKERCVQEKFTVTVLLDGLDDFPSSEDAETYFLHMRIREKFLEVFYDYFNELSSLYTEKKIYISLERVEVSLSGADKQNSFTNHNNGTQESLIKLSRTGGIPADGRPRGGEAILRYFEGFDETLEKLDTVNRYFNKELYNTTKEARRRLTMLPENENMVGALRSFGDGEAILCEFVPGLSDLKSAMHQNKLGQRCGVESLKSLARGLKILADNVCGAIFLVRNGLGILDIKLSNLGFVEDPSCEYGVRGMIFDYTYLSPLNRTFLSRPGYIPEDKKRLNNYSYMPPEYTKNITTFSSNSLIENGLLVGNWREKLLPFDEREMVYQFGVCLRKLIEYFETGNDIVSSTLLQTVNGELSFMAEKKEQRPNLLELYLFITNLISLIEERHRILFNFNSSTPFAGFFK